MFEKATSEEMNIDECRRTGRTFTSEQRGSVKWPFAAMDVGTVVVIRLGEYGPQNPQAYASTYAFKVKKKFRTRKVAADVWRIWRIA